LKFCLEYNTLKKTLKKKTAPHLQKNQEDPHLSIIYALYFALGIFSLISQTLLLREIWVVAQGNEIAFGITFFHWLIGIFLGAMAGGLIVQYIKTIWKVFIPILIILCLFSPLALSLIRLLYSISQTPGGTYISFTKLFIFSGFIILPLSAFIGFVFPLAAKLPEQTPQKSDPVHLFSHVYIYEGLGFVAGGMVFSFFMAGRLNPFLSIGLTTLPIILITTIISIKKGYRLHLAFTLLLLGANLLFITPLGSTRLNRWLIQKQWTSISSETLIKTQESKYQHLAMAEREGQFRMFSNGQYATAFPDENDQLILASHLVCQHQNPKKIMVLGEGISGLAVQLLKFNLSHIISVEIDGVLIQFLQSFLPESYQVALSDNRFKLVNRDGRKLVKEMAQDSDSQKQIKSHFDIVYLNITEPSTLLANRFYTRDFFLDISQILTDGGFLALQVTSSENYLQGTISNYTTSVFNTLKSVFPHIIITPGVKNIFFASNSRQNITDSAAELKKRFKKTAVKPQKLGLIFRSLYPLEQTQFLKKSLNQHPLKSINTDNKPISTFYFNKILGWYSGEDLEGIFRFFQQISIKNLALSLIVLLLIFSLIFHSFRAKRNALTSSTIYLTTAIAGFSGISLELIIIFIFQNNFGYIYHNIGLIIGLFMLGLPLGAYTSLKVQNSHANKKKPALHSLIIIQLMTALIALILPEISGAMQGTFIQQFSIYLLTIMCGFLVGAIFTVALVLMVTKQSAARAAGFINASDHLGAAAGALLIGTFLLPLLGLGGSCHLLALLATFSAILLFIILINLNRSA
jgi:spermidine synthase